MARSAAYPAATIYYLAYGLNHVDVAGADRLWGLVGLVVLFSVVLHGLTVTPIMRLLDRQHGRDPDKDNHPLLELSLIIKQGRTNVRPCINQLFFRARFGAAAASVSSSSSG